MNDLVIRSIVNYQPAAPRPVRYLNIGTELLVYSVYLALIQSSRGGGR